MTKGSNEDADGIFNKLIHLSCYSRLQVDGKCKAYA